MPIDDRRPPGNRDDGESCAADVIAAREAAAVQHRHWVRINRVCNQRCLFCLDADAHDGGQFPADQVRAEILRGFTGPDVRLVISGGEASVHPDFLSFLRNGREVGYTHIQTITNGRMFSNADFARRAAEAGLDEATFSIHGHTAALHDTLTGTPGSFAQAVTGLRNLQRSGRVIVNVDIVINRMNLPHLDDIISFFRSLGVNEFDLLQIIPFGRAWPQHRDLLFYDVPEAFPHLHKAFRHGRDPGVFLWTNRFPVVFLEDLEELIQDPHKLHDEARGRRDQFEALATRGEALTCRGERCRYCFVQPFCDALDTLRDRLREHGAEALGVNLRGEHAAPDFGAPPRSPGEAARPLAALSGTCRFLRVEADGVEDLAEFLAGLTAYKARFAPGAALELDLVRLPELSRLRALLNGCGLPLRLVRVASADLEGPAADYLAADDFTLEVVLTPASARRLLAERAAFLTRRTRGGLALGLRPHGSLTEARRRDGDWRRVLAAWRAVDPDGALTPARGLPACFGQPEDLGSPQPHELTFLDILRHDGVIDPHRFTGWYIRHGYYVRSLRCAACRLYQTCRGMHINHVRLRGFREQRPLPPLPPADSDSSS